jgi:Protein of unknown function (DUF3147)
MLGELGLRFLLGGAIVSLFAGVAAAFQPKRFAGIFAAAPSVALVTLALAYLEHGGWYVATEGRSLSAGAVALFAYSSACVELTRRSRVPVGLGAALAWTVWLAVAFGLGWLGVASGVLS